MGVTHDGLILRCLCCEQVREARLWTREYMTPQLSSLTGATTHTKAQSCLSESTQEEE